MKRGKFIYQTSVGLDVLLPVVKTLHALKLDTDPYFATGIKIGEVTQNTAIVWVRLTKETKPVGKGTLIPKVVYLDEANGESHPMSYFKEKYNRIDG